MSSWQSLREHPAFWSVALGVVMPVTRSPETPGLLPVNEPGVKPLATTTWAAVADFTSTLLRVDAGNLHLHKGHCRCCRIESHLIWSSGSLYYFGMRSKELAAGAREEEEGSLHSQLDGLCRLKVASHSQAEHTVLD